jgi:predicted DNA-binding transcriptional regulator AlpA
VTASLLTTSEVAARLGIHRSRVLRLAKRYGIGQKLGPRAWVFTDADIAALRAHSTGKAGRPPHIPPAP